MRLVICFLFTLCAVPASSKAAVGKHFNRAIFVIFENTRYNTALNQSFFGSLAKKGALLSNLYAIKHPSQPNYVALTSGSTQGVYSDGVYDIDSRNIVDLLEEKGVSWGVYAEGFPGHCYTGKSKNGYDRKHNPFISYLNIQKNPKRCSYIYDTKQFEVDSRNYDLPQYVFYVPNDKHSGHDTSVSYANDWYEKTFSHLLEDENFMEDTIVITTFDESSYFSKNQIYTSIVGPGVQPGQYDDYLTLYSLLRLIEDNWELGDLGQNDSTSSSVPNIWRKD